MNASERSDALPETDHVQEHRGKPSVDTVPHDTTPTVRPHPQNPEGLHIPDGSAFETFVGGAGI